MGLMRFGQLLSTLKATDRIEKAVYYEKMVTEKFGEILSKEQIENLDVNEIVEILEIVNALMSGSADSSPSPFQSRIDELRAQGFTVSVGEKYR
jgi:hypothetical protein